jgi:hypothetical protein
MRYLLILALAATYLKSKQLLATYLASLPDSPANPDGRYTKGLVSPLSPENSQTSFAHRPADTRTPGSSTHPIMARCRGNFFVMAATKQYR